MMPFPGGIEANANATLLFSFVAAVIYAFALDMPPKWARTAAKTLAVALLSRDGEKAKHGEQTSNHADHVAYVALFARSGGGLQLLSAGSWRGALALAMAAFSIIMLAALWRRVGPQLRIPIAVYVAAILAMGLSAITTGSAWVIAGAVLFIASDGLLAAERFLLAGISPHRVWMRHAVWVLYYAAQLAITLGFLLGAAG